MSMTTTPATPTRLVSSEVSAMKAFTLDALGTEPAVRDDLPIPTPGAGEVLVRVQVSSINPADAGIAAGMGAQMVEFEFPVTIGRDYAGTLKVHIQDTYELDRAAEGVQALGTTHTQGKLALCVA